MQCKVIINPSHDPCDRQRNNHGPCTHAAPTNPRLLPATESSITGNTVGIKRDRNMQASPSWRSQPGWSGRLSGRCWSSCKTASRSAYPVPTRESTSENKGIASIRHASTHNPALCHRDHSTDRQPKDSSQALQQFSSKCMAGPKYWPKALKPPASVPPFSAQHAY